jgi:myo-inositol-1(or 4)-monophosphatase
LPGIDPSAGPTIAATTDYVVHGERLAAAVREAGALALTTFRGELKSWFKGNDGHTSPVSDADLAVDALLRERLSVPEPGIGWLSEETEDRPEQRAGRLVFVVDPIDGTRSYLAGRPDWAISAALVEDGRPVAAALYAPVTDELFTGVIGRGALLNGAPLQARQGAGLDGILIAGPKPLIERLRPDSGFVIAPRIGSLALRLARVADGTLDAALAGGNSHDWDLAAADLLVHEAGGALTTFSGAFLTYNRPDPVHGALVAAGPGRHAALIDLTRDRRF